MNCPAVFQSNCIKWQSSPWFTSSLGKKLANCLKPLTISHLLEKPDPSALVYSVYECNHTLGGDNLVGS